MYRYRRQTETDRPHRDRYYRRDFFTVVTVALKFGLYLANIGPIDKSLKFTF